jgi:hypothetical protein
MALTKCHECGKEVSTTAAACPHCGAKPKRQSAGCFSVVVLAILGAVLFLILVAENNDPPSRVSSPNPVVDMRPEWRASTYRDEASGHDGRDARIDSENVVDFRFPYAGPQRAQLQIDVHPRFGKRAILSVRRGQFICSVSGCSVNVRFDSGPVHSFDAIGPADHSSTALFITNHPRFLASARKAKRVYIEAVFYQEGSRTFEFSLEGFQDPDATKPPTKPGK